MDQLFFKFVPTLNYLDLLYQAIPNIEHLSFLILVKKLQLFQFIENIPFLHELVDRYDLYFIIHVVSDSSFTDRHIVLVITLIVVDNHIIIDIFSLVQIAKLITKLILLF